MTDTKLLACGFYFKYENTSTSLNMQSKHWQLNARPFPAEVAATILTTYKDVDAKSISTGLKVEILDVWPK